MYDEALCCSNKPWAYALAWAYTRVGLSGGFYCTLTTLNLLIHSFMCVIIGVLRGFTLTGKPEVTGQGDSSDPWSVSLGRMFGHEFVAGNLKHICIAWCSTVKYR